MTNDTPHPNPLPFCGLAGSRGREGEGPPPISTAATSAASGLGLRASNLIRGPDVVIGVSRLRYLFASALLEHSRSARYGWGRRGWQIAGSGPCEATAGAGATRFSAGVIGTPFVTDTGQHTFETINAAQQPTWQKTQIINRPPGNSAQHPVAVILMPA